MVKKSEFPYTGELFQVEHKAVDGRTHPYEFVHRIGSTTVLPVMYNRWGQAQVLMVENTRAGEEPVIELPGGNADGGFTDPEDPLQTGLRELHEETGYVPDNPVTNHELYKLKQSSRGIVYSRHLVVVRGLLYVSGEHNNPREVIVPKPIPVKDYLDPIFELERSGVQPEVALAIARTANRHGKEAVVDWLETGANLGLIQESFAPELQAVTAG